MKGKLSENIRRFRREENLTQEQLAEAMGVSVSAVHKWESGQSAPELRLIPELAELFHTSTDVLLGYEWQNGSAAACLDRIAALRKKKRCAEAVSEAEKALKRYPNHFDLVYQSGLLYLEFGEDARRRKAVLRAIELLEHACELISQNQDETVSEVSIRTQIAKAHLLLPNADAALRILKACNVCGVNDALIGMVLGDYLHDADGAETYLGRAFSTFADEINSIMSATPTCFSSAKTTLRPSTASCGFEPCFGASSRRMRLRGLTSTTACFWKPLRNAIASWENWTRRGISCGKPTRRPFAMTARRRAR